MTRAIGRLDGSNHRRSLLPQPSSNSQDSARTDIQQHLPNPGISNLITAAGHGSFGDTNHRRTTGMLPPSVVQRPQHSRTPSLRRPSTATLPSQDNRDTPTRVGTSSNKEVPHSSARTSLHGRSVSHHVGRTTIPATSTSKIPPSRQTSMKRRTSPFTTMQQSYTPKKPVLPRSSSPFSELLPNGVSSTECSHLQMELAQLHLLHRTAHSVQHGWEQSAEKAFHFRFTALAERHTELKEITQQQQALINQLALVQWSDGETGTQFADSIALLSRTIVEICSLLAIDGKYTRILGLFESWFGQVLQIQGQREEDSGRHIGLSFVEGIGDGWKAEAMVLERELTYCWRDLNTIATVPPGSSLGRIQTLYRKLVRNMIEEIDEIQWIENEITIQETSWMENTIQGIASTVDNDIGSIASVNVSARQ